jgi:hypothetical protein
MKQGKAVGMTQEKSEQVEEGMKGEPRQDASRMVRLVSVVGWRFVVHHLESTSYPLDDSHQNAVVDVASQEYGGSGHEAHEGRQDGGNPEGYSCIVSSCPLLWWEFLQTNGHNHPGLTALVIPYHVSDRCGSESSSSGVPDDLRIVGPVVVNVIGKGKHLLKGCHDIGHMRVSAGSVFIPG